MNMSIRVGVIGLGNMGTAHATCIMNGNINGIELISVCDINEEILVNFSKNNGKAYAKNLSVKAYFLFVFTGKRI